MQVVQLYKFDYRLANDIDPKLQKLRCRVNYHALRFTKPIQELGSRVVMKMREMDKRFIAVHLRSVLFCCGAFLLCLDDKLVEREKKGRGMEGSERKGRI